MTTQGPARRVEVDEVIPPGRDQSRPVDPTLKMFAHILDELFRIPGTSIRFGLDPLLGLLPGIGDSLTGLVSTALLALSVRQGIPKIVVIRMALNILINTLLGAIPGVGDAFSVFFKSNVRNYALYQQHARGARESTRGDWAFVVVLVGAVAVLLILALIGMLFLLSKMAQYLP